ncbi:MAG: hypothetical protein JWP42_2214 [Pseudomonas sp.]|nr:hypothetical protein [Pseudomonas sp.]
MYFICPVELSLGSLQRLGRACRLATCMSRATSINTTRGSITEFKALTHASRQAHNERTVLARRPSTPPVESSD